MGGRRRPYLAPGGGKKKSVVGWHGAAPTRAKIKKSRFAFLEKQKRWERGTSTHSEGRGGEKKKRRKPDFCKENVQPIPNRGP